MNKPNYKGFVKHVNEMYAKGLPINTSDLRRLAKKYNVPILPAHKINKEPV